MDKYKVSNYNFFFTTKEGVDLAFNGISGGFARIKDNERVKRFTENPNAEKRDEKDNKIFNSLLKGLFIIHSNIDELSLLKLRFWGSRFNANSLLLTVAPTLNCNFACIYCYEREKGSNLRINMTEKKAQSLIKFISKQIESGIKNLSISWYGGEPLLKFDIIKYMTNEVQGLCKKEGVSYNAGITTNGYLLKKDVFNSLLEAQIKSVQITLDGPPDIHNHFRPLIDGSPTFSVILKNLKEFTDFLEQKNEKMRVAIRVNISEKNPEAPMELIDILDKEGLKNKISIYPGQIVSDNSTLSCLSDSAFSDIEANFMGKLLDRGWRVNLPSLIRGTFCGAYVANSYTIDPQLNLYRCWEGIGVDLFKLGYIDEKGKPHFNERNSQWLSLDPFEIDECRNCKFLPLCMGGCLSKSIVPWIKYGNLQTGRCVSFKHNLLKQLEIYYKYTLKKER